MPKKIKILVNGATLENANLIPLLYKIKIWQSKGAEIHLVGNTTLDRKIKKLNILKKNYKFINIRNTKLIRGKFDLITEGFKRNLFLLRQIRKFSDFDLIYSISSVLDLIIFPFFLKMKYKKIQWVTVFDNIVPFWDPGNKFIRLLAWFYFQLSLILLKKADKIFTVTRDLERYLRQKNFQKQKIIVLPNGIESNLIRKAKKNSKYNIDALFVGRINETKGIYDMLKVLDIVKQQFPKFKLAIAGAGDKHTEIKFKNKVRKMKLQNNIDFLGYKKGLEKFNIIKSSKCFWFLSVSKSESFGVALLEAVCCGLPALVYNLNPYKEIYKNGEVIMTKKGNFKQVANKIIALFRKGCFQNQKGKLLLDEYSLNKICLRESKYLLINK